MAEERTIAGLGTGIGVEDGKQVFLSFYLGDETFAISVAHIKEIVELESLTHMPMLPDFVRGAIDLRGVAVPVLDLPLRLGGAAAKETGRTCVVIVELATDESKMDVGLMVDAVSKVMEFDIADVQNPPSVGGQINVEFIEGMGKIGEGQFMIILDVDRILSLSDLDRLKEVAELRPDDEAVRSDG